MEKYLGEKLVNQEDVEEFKNFTSSDWSMYFIESYGQIEGEWHKSWVLDQVARILKGTPIIIHKAEWSDGSYEYRVNISKETSDAYKQWRVEMLGEYDEFEGEYEYSYEEGSAP